MFDNSRICETEKICNNYLVDIEVSLLYVVILEIVFFLWFSLHTDTLQNKT